MSKNIGNKIIWRSIEGIGVNGVQFITQMILARLLMPEDFGIIAILNIFISFANTIVQNGLGSAVIQKKNAKDEDFSTVFFTECFFAITLYILIYVFSPIISIYYNYKNIIRYLRIFATTIIIAPISSIQITVLRCRLDFKSSCIANTIAVILQAISGISFAYYGYGIWSLIYSQIIYRFSCTLFLYLLTKWNPSLSYSFKSLKTLFKYSWKLSVGWVIGNIYNDLFALIIGKNYSKIQLGFYSKGNTIPNVFNRIITQIITSVMFPVISKKQDDLSKVLETTRKMISITAVIVFPLMTFIGATANEYVLLLLTKKWMPIVPIIQIFCIPFAINTINNANMQTFNALGRSDIFLKIEIIKRSLTIILVFIFAKIDFYLMICSVAFMGIISLIINTLYNNILIKYKIYKFLIDLMPGIMVSICFFIIIQIINCLQLKVQYLLLSNIISCGILYLLFIICKVNSDFLLINKAIQEIIYKRK